VACRNPLLADERTRKRSELLEATRRNCARFRTCPARQKPLRGKTRSGSQFGKVVNKFKMSKHIDTTITDTDLSFERKTENINAERCSTALYRSHQRQT